VDFLATNVGDKSFRDSNSEVVDTFSPDQVTRVHPDLPVEQIVEHLLRAGLRVEGAGVAVGLRLSRVYQWVRLALTSAL
jgi:hypothetical protein